MSLPHGRLFTEETDHVRKYSADSAVDFAVKLEPAWSTEQDSPDQPSAVYSTVQPMSDNTSWSLLSLKRGRVCQHCSAAFVLFSSLELHLASVHGDKLHMVLPGSSTPDRCDAGNCSNTDIDKKVDSLRKRTIDDNDTGDKDGQKRRRQHVCDVCGKSFTEAGNLTKHKRIHTRERPFKCPQCDSGFNALCNLQYHIKSAHEGARPHVCDVCGAAFYQTSHLTEHRIIHTGEKPHVCSDCGKCFARPSHLAQHRRTHSREKPHSCPHCPAAFSFSTQLKRHVQKVHE